MNRRTGLVGLFVGLVLVIGVWLIMPGAEVRPEKAEKKVAAREKEKEPVLKDGKVEGRLRAIPLDESPDLTLRSLAARQERMQGLVQQRQVGRPRGVYALDQQGVAAAVEGRKKDLEACYETALFHTPELAGTLTLVLQVEPEEGSPYGKVTSVDTESSLDATVLEGCVATVFEELKFETTEPTTLRYPVTFEPPGQK